MKTFIEHIIALRSRLKKFGVDIDDPTIMLNVKKISANNSSNIECIMNKKHILIAYHLIRQNVEVGVVNIGWILKTDNIVEKLTTRLTEAKRKKLFGDWNC